MLRFNNQSAAAAALNKPVDFYRPLTVDVSVEYELPKEVAPPPGSAPLLIIHPSAYFRSKIGHSSSISSHQRQPQNPRSQAQLSRSNGGTSGNDNPSSTSTASSRLISNELNSTLYYLTKGSTMSQDHHNSSVSTASNGRNQNHTQQAGNSTAATVAHLRNIRPYGGNHGSSVNSSSRSRNTAHEASRNCVYANCDECRDGGSGSGTQILNKRIGSASTIAKKSHHQQQQQIQQQHLQRQQNQIGHPIPMDRNSYLQQHQSTTTNNYNNSPPNNNLGLHGSNAAAAAPSGMNMSFLQQNTNGSSSSAKSSSATTTTTTPGFGNANGNNSGNNAASHKRLRMMNQQQQPNLLPPFYNPPSQPVEPLNLAITPSASTSLLNHSYHNNQFSSFGVTYGQNKMSGGGGGTGPSANAIGIAGLNYASTFPHNHQNSLIPSQKGLYTARLLPKDNNPIPVDKGSGGSDSGVCSENDSDVSPPMAHPFTSTGQPRRSLLAQELPSSGCYCCCCPTTTTATATPTESNSNSTAVISSFRKYSKSSGKQQSSSSSSAFSYNHSQNHNSNSNSTSISKNQFIPTNSNMSAFGTSYASSSLTPGTPTHSVAIAAAAPDLYGSPINMMTTSSAGGLYGDGNHAGQLGNLSLSSESVSMALGNSHCSPMDSTSAAYQYRKWWTSGLIADNSHHNSTSFGRWFQV